MNEDHIVYLGPKGGRKRGEERGSEAEVRGGGLRAGGHSEAEVRGGGRRRRRRGSSRRRRAAEHVAAPLDRGGLVIAHPSAAAFDTLSARSTPKGSASHAIRVVILNGH